MSRLLLIVLIVLGIFISACSVENKINIENNISQNTSFDESGIANLPIMNNSATNRTINQSFNMSPIIPVNPIEEVNNITFYAISSNDSFVYASKYNHILFKGDEYVFDVIEDHIPGEIDDTTLRLNIYIKNEDYPDYHLLFNYADDYGYLQKGYINNLSIKNGVMLLLNNSTLFKNGKSKFTLVYSTPIMYVTKEDFNFQNGSYDFIKCDNKTIETSLRYLIDSKRNKDRKPTPMAIGIVRVISFQNKSFSKNKIDELTLTEKEERCQDLLVLIGQKLLEDDVVRYLDRNFQYFESDIHIDKNIGKYEISLTLIS